MTVVCSHSFCVECIQLCMPPTYTPLIRRYTYTTDSTPTYLVEVGHNAWFIPMDTAHTSQTPVQGYHVTSTPNLQRVLQDAYSRRTSIATPATLLQMPLIFLVIRSAFPWISPHSSLLWTWKGCPSTSQLMHSEFLRMCP